MAQRRPTSPPLAPFPYMSANFDFPHASASPPPPSASRDSETYESFQQLITRRELERESAVPDSPPPRSGGVAERRTAASLIARRSRPAYAALVRVSSSSDSRPAAASPPTANGRPRATPSERYLRRARRRQQRSTEPDSATDMLDSLTDFPVSNPFAMANSSGRPRSSTSENDIARRQTKRRKLEHEATFPQPYDGFKYGYKGQVVPGRLKMEIMSCDGGEYNLSTSYGLYPIQNVLKNDKSVYCSERSRCNLLLKHIAEMPFSLEKVVIRAPDRGFTAPVQEGLVFVSMSSDDLIQSTSAYELEYETSSPRLSPAPESAPDQQLSLREAIEDPYIWENSRQGREEAMEDQIERLRLRSRRSQMEPNVRSNQERRTEERRNVATQDRVSIENCDDLDESSYPAAGISAPTPPQFTITTESDEEESDEYEDVPSAAIMADRLRRESRWRADSDEEEDDFYRFPPSRPMDSFTTYDEYRRWRNERHLDPIRATRLRTPSRIEAKEDSAETDGLIAPHARFFIAKHKNKITIKFHPAVSGKFVLLKLWSPTHDGNIDIESVQFYGYSGPRYFPAVQPA